MRLTSTSFKLTSCLLILFSTGLSFANGNGNGYGNGHYRPDFKCEVPPAPCPCPPSLMDGFYVGGDIGYDIITTRARFDRHGNIFFGDTFNITGNPRLAAVGWDAGLHAGWGKYFGCDCNIYLGAEVWGNWSSAEDTINITTIDGHAHAKFRRNGDVSLSLLPGIKINHATLLYGRAGFDWAWFDTDATVTVFTPSPFSPFPVPVTFSRHGGDNNNRHGWIVGVGMESLLIDAWSVRLEADYTSYCSSGGSTSFGRHRRPNDYRFTAGINYHFCL